MIENRPPASPDRPVFPRVSLPSRPAVVAGAGLAVVAMLATAARDALAVFVVAALVAVVLDPIVTRLAKRDIPRPLAAAVVVAASTLAAVLVVFVAGAKLAAEAGHFLAAIPGWLTEARAWYADAPIPSEGRVAIDALVNGAARMLADINVAGAALEVLTNGLGVAAVVFGLMPFVVFYMLADRPASVRRLTESIPDRWRGDAVAIGRLAFGSITAYLRSEAILMALLAGLTWLGLQGVALIVDPAIADFALFLTLVAAFSELVPMLGPWIAATPAVAFALTLGPHAAIAVAALYLVLAIIEGQILVPIVEGRQFAMHPVAVALAMVVGTATAGLIGTIVALPALASGLAIFSYVFRRSTGELTAPAGDVWSHPDADGNGIRRVPVVPGDRLAASRPLDPIDSRRHPFG